MKFAEIIMFSVICTLIAVFVFREPIADRHFWYPIALYDATCQRYSGEVYVMDNSIGWRSWPYYLEKKTKQEIILNDSCIFKKIRSLPKYKRSIQNKLNAEQTEFLIEGFTK